MFVRWPSPTTGRMLLLVLCIVTASNAEAGPDATQPGDHKFSFEHQGIQRHYLVHVPPQYTTQGQWPVVLMLHGRDANPKNAIHMTGMSTKADKAGFLVVYPYGSGLLKKHVLTWNAANCCGYAMKEGIDDVGFIREVIARLESDYHADSKRIFVAGMSNGGMMAYRLACELSDKIAAIAAVAAAFNDKTCTPSEPVSVVIFHGTGDYHVPFDGGTGIETPDGRIDRSIPETLTFWIDANDCNSVSDVQFIEAGRIVREEFPGGRNATAVVLYTIKSGGHAWPGGKSGYLFDDPPTPWLNATDKIWEFFVEHPKP